MDRNDHGTSRAIARAGAVTLASVLIVIALQAPVGAHDDGTTGHLWHGHFKLMKDPGTINDAGNPVHWTKLQGVPAGFADGTDHLRLPGLGLLLDDFGNMAINQAITQRRVHGTCPPGQAVKSIGASGTVACTKGPSALSFTDADTGIIPNAGDFEGHLALSAGTWMITAKIRVGQAGDETELFVECQLRAGGETDTAVVALEDVNNSVGYVANSTLPMQLLATLSRSGNASVWCRDDDVGNAFGRDLSIIAVRVTG